MSIFEHTKNTRTIIDGNLRYIRSDVPTSLSKKERQWLIGNNILTIIDLKRQIGALTAASASRSKRVCNYSEPLSKNRQGLIHDSTPNRFKTRNAMLDSSADI